MPSFCAKPACVLLALMLCLRPTLSKFKLNFKSKPSHKIMVSPPVRA